MVEKRTKGSLIEVVLLEKDGDVVGRVLAGAKHSR